MKKIAIILALLAINMTFAFGQTATDPILAKKVFGGYQYSQGGQILSMNQLVNTMKPNEQAYQLVKSGQTTQTVAMVFSAAGGFMIGWPLGAAIAGGEPNWVMAGIGAGLVVVSIPISQSANKKIKQAVDVYNGGLQTSSFWDKNELKFAMTGNGIGLTLTF